MEAARRLGSLVQEAFASEEPKISFFNDFSAEVVRRRLDNLLTQNEEVKTRLIRQKMYEHGDQAWKVLVTNHRSPL